MAPAKERLSPTWVKAAKARRAVLFEALGSHRYSRPALHQLDTRLAAVLPRSGTFLEVGANDGYAQSNTYYLERVLGWRGILIEPIPQLHRACTRLRRSSFCVQAACVPQSVPGATVELRHIDLMSVTLGQQDREEEATRIAPRGQSHANKGAIHAPARAISDIIDSSPLNELTFMSIDVEGAEKSLLAGLDLERHVPEWLLIETNHVEEVQGILRGHMDQVEQMTQHDYLFRRSCSM